MVGRAFFLFSRIDEELLSYVIDDRGEKLPAIASRAALSQAITAIITL
jgi:hypothetical protein